MALTPSQPGQQPVLYEQCLELVYRLAEQAHSREAMLSLLRKPPYSLLMSQIGVVLQVDEDRPQEVSFQKAAEIISQTCIVLREDGNKSQKVLFQTQEWCFSFVTDMR